MVTSFSFFLALQIFVEFGFGSESDTVDAGKHFPLLIATPVGTSDADKFKGTNFASVFDMWTFTKISKEVAHVIERDFRAFWEVFNQLNFVFLLVITSPVKCFHLRHNALFHWEFTRNDATHLFLDFLKVGIRNFGLTKVDIIVETGINSRANAKCGCRIKLLNCGRKNVAQRVTHFF